MYQSPLPGILILQELLPMRLLMQLLGLVQELLQQVEVLLQYIILHA